MHSKYYTLMLTFFFSFTFGQLKLEFTLINSVANVTIYNESKENYVLPIDVLHFRPYEADCGVFSDYEMEFPSLSLMVNIINSDSKREDYALGYKHFDNIDSIEKNIDTKRENFQKKIKDWGKKNNIKDYNLALINYNLNNNLIYLKPHEKVSFKIKFDLHNVTNQELIFYNYILEKTSNYIFYLSLCNYKNINKYLTSSQNKKLKKYKLFTGSLESNKIELKH